MFSLFVSIYFWFFLATTSLILFPWALLLWMITWPFDPRRRINHRFTCFWASLYTWFNPVWRVKISGRENLPKDSACILAANHQSVVDIFVLFRLRTPFKWVSKIENFRIPIIGWNMRLCNYIPLKRGSLKGNIEMLRACRESLKVGDSLIIFPEGTRTLDGKLKRFKAGAFDLAKRAGVPVVPVAIDGSFDALPRKGLLLRGIHRITVTILKPIPAEQTGSMTLDEISAETKRRIAETIGEPWSAEEFSPQSDTSPAAAE